MKLFSLSMNPMITASVGLHDSQTSVESTTITQL